MKIHVSETSSTNKGDLFTDRVKDIMHSLNFEITRINVHKSGRELDLVGRHRLEGKKVVVECKAQASPIGGGDINKFIGVMDAERENGRLPTGYMISISGFTATAVEQEEGTGRRRCVLMGPVEIVETLTSSKVVAKPSVIIAQAARLSTTAELEVEEELDLIAHEFGWYFCVHFKQDGIRVSHAIAHANGRITTRSTADQILSDTPGAIRDLGRSNLLAEEATSISREATALRATALQQYRDFIDREFGVIRQEGMPVNADLGSTAAIRLEDLYVALRLQRASSGPVEGQLVSDSIDGLTQPEVPEPEHISPGVALEGAGHLAVLGPPGAGKTTLIKWLATSYNTDDLETLEVIGLPAIGMLPIIIRCRELGEWTSVHQAIGSVAERAELGDLIDPFMEMVTDRLMGGEVLLLVDGLDEISDQGERLRFSHQLRTFVSRYARISLVVTSRQAGYRLVAPAMSEYADTYRLLELTDDDVTQLTLGWCAHVYGTGAADIQRAREISDSINGDWRLRRLAETPLLLTMLLVVQRWSGGGDIPRRRSILYARAVEVLLNTWNVEGHDPLDLDEALPQLAYVGYAMTFSGQQQLSHSELLAELRKARRDMPEVLGYCRTSPRDFLLSVELRSSLLIQVGFVDGATAMEGVYEFKHLMFQEYLAASALVNDWYPGSANLGVVDRIRPLVKDDHWTEVITLAAVLAGRRGGPIVSLVYDAFLEADSDVALHSMESSEWAEATGRRDRLIRAVHACLADGAQVAPAQARAMLRNICIFMRGIDLRELDDLLQSRYADQLRQVVREGIEDDVPTRYYSAASNLHYFDFAGLSAVDLAEQLGSLLSTTDKGAQNTALAVLLMICYQNYSVHDPDEKVYTLTDDEVVDIRTECLPLVIKLCLEATEEQELRSRVWPLCWMTVPPGVAPSDLGDLHGKLVSLLLERDHLLAHYAGWIVANTCREDFEMAFDEADIAKLHSLVEEFADEGGQILRGSLALQYYAGLRSYEDIKDGVKAF